MILYDFIKLTTFVINFENILQNDVIKLKDKMKSGKKI